MMVLVHACCAPCLWAPARLLITEGKGITAFWYNPNVQPYREFKKRLVAFRDLVAREGWPASVDDRYDVDFFFREVTSGAADRCGGCYLERLKRAAAQARALGCSAFTTTLLISPHQNFEGVVDAGRRAADEYGVEFLNRDFRDLDAESHRAAREMGLYLQGYCGCLYSEEERYRPRGSAGG